MSHSFGPLVSGDASPPQSPPIVVLDNATRGFSSEFNIGRTPRRSHHLRDQALEFCRDVIVFKPRRRPHQWLENSLLIEDLMGIEC
jgi:hypothetical protein